MTFLEDGCEKDSIPCLLPTSPKRLVGSRKMMSENGGHASNGKKHARSPWCDTEASLDDTKATTHKVVFFDEKEFPTEKVKA